MNTSLSAEMPGEWEMGTFTEKKGMEQRKAFGRVSEPGSSWEQWDCPHGGRQVSVGTGKTTIPGACRAGGVGTTTSSWAVEMPRMAVNRTETQRPEHSWLNGLENPC